MRIAYVYTRPVPSKDTDSQQVVSTVDALAGAGVDVDLIVPWGLAAALGGPRRLDARVRRFYGVERPFTLRPVYTIEPSPIEAERLAHAAVAALGLGRGYDLVHTRSRATVTLCAAIGVPVVFETYRRLGRDSPALASVLRRLARRSAFLGVITHSRQSADSLRDAGIPSAKLAVIHNGYAPSAFAPTLSRAEARAELGMPEDGHVVVYTGNVQPQKGLDRVLDLAAQAPRVTFLIVGGKARDLALLRRDVTARGLANVQTPGWVPAAALRPYLYAADVLIIPPTAGPLERWGKTVLPMKVFGYLAAGRPILAPRTPDLEEVLEDGVNAYLVAPDDHDAASAGLRALIEDGALAERLATGAHATADGLTWDARASRVRAAYERWLAAAPGS